MLNTTALREYVEAQKPLMDSWASEHARAQQPLPEAWASEHVEEARQQPAGAGAWAAEFEASTAEATR